MENEEFSFEGFQCVQKIEGLKMNDLLKLSNSGLILENDFNSIYTFDDCPVFNFESLCIDIDNSKRQLTIITLFKIGDLKSSFYTKNIIETNYTSYNITHIWEKLISKHCRKHYCILKENNIENDYKVILNEDALRNKMIDKFRESYPNLYDCF